MVCDVGIFFVVDVCRTVDVADVVAASVTVLTSIVDLDVIALIVDIVIAAVIVAAITFCFCCCFSC